LIDGGAFSTTSHFSSLVKFHNLGTFVGQETNGSYSCNANATELLLPNSGIRTRIAQSTFATAVSGFELGPGIMPDVEVTPTLDHILTGADPVLAEALHLIQTR